MAAELHEPLLSRVLQELAAQEERRQLERGAAFPDSFERLGDDLLVSVLSHLSSAQLRTVAGVCRRWASLLRTHGELWSATELALPPRQSRGRDRRQSYTTPCALDTGRLISWLVARRATITQLTIFLQYPDAFTLLPALLPPLASALRTLTLRGCAKEWPHQFVDWRWLAGMTQLEALDLRDSVPDLAALVLPTSLQALSVDRVGEQDALDLEGSAEGWDELPPSLSALARLRRLSLGGCKTAWVQEDEEAFAPLTGCTQLTELALEDGALHSVPDALAALSASLQVLSFRGCIDWEGYERADILKSEPFRALAALSSLRVLDLTDCLLAELPPWLGCLHSLRTLRLAGNCITELPPARGGQAPTAAAAAAATAVAVAAALRAGKPLASAVGGRAASAASAAAAALPPVELPPALEELDLSGNQLRTLPTLPSTLTRLDVTRCSLCLAPSDWRALVASLPRLRTLRHSCPLLAAEVRGHGGAAQLAAAVGGCPQLCIEQWPPPSSSHVTARARSASSLDEMAAAAAMLSGGACL